MFTPIEKYNNYPTKEYFLANIMVALAGRASERILFNNSTDESVNYISAKLFENVPIIFFLLDFIILYNSLSVILSSFIIKLVLLYFFIIE